MTFRGLILGFLGTFSLLASFWLLLNSTADQQFLIVNFAATALLLEIGAFRLTDWGFSTCAPAIYLAACMEPRLGLEYACYFALLGLSGRALFRRSAAIQACLESVPLFVWLVFVELSLRAGWPAWGPVIIYSLISVAVSYFGGEGSLQQSARLRGGLFLVTALILAVATTKQSYSSLLLFLFTTAVLSYAQGCVSRVTEQEQEERLGREVWRLREHKATLQRELERIQSGSQDKLEQARLMATTNDTLEKARTTQTSLESLLRLVKKVVPSRSAVLFLHKGQELRVSLAKSPDAASLAAKNESGLGEPVVRQAWREGRALAKRQRNWPKKLIPQERSCLAAPIPGYGILYLGKEVEPFTPQEVRKVWLIARQSSIFLTRLSEAEGQQSALRFVSDERRILAGWVHRLNFLIEGSRKLFAAGNIAEALKATESCLAELVPHDEFKTFQYLKPGTVLPADPDWPDPLLLELAGAAVQSAGPTLVNRAHKEGQRWFLVVALETEPTQIVVLASWEPFEKEHRDLLSLTAKQTEVALNQIALRTEFAETSKVIATSQIAAGLSHEMNTPMAAIQLALESAERVMQKSPERALERLEQAQEAFEQASSVLNALLYYTTSYAFENMESIDLVELLREQVRSFARTGQLVTQLEQLVMKGHRLDLEQMFLHLFKNADQASDSQTFRVEIRKTNGYAQVDVIDQGPGIDQEVRDKIFDPFFTTKPLGQGLGLGLSIARRVVELHDGTLRLISSQVGAHFEVRLPIEP